MNGEIITEYEKFFKSRHYNKIKEDKFEILKGSCPVMISAPHSLNHYRNGKIKKADTYTGAFLLYLHEKLGVHGIYSTNTSCSDPNSDNEEQSEYKKTLKKYILDNNIKFLLDIHGSDKKHDFLFDMGTDSGKTLKGREYLEKLMILSAQQKFRNYTENEIIMNKEIISSNRRFRASGINTVTNYIYRNCGIPAIQLEISKLCRNTGSDYIIYMEKTLEFLEEFLSITVKLNMNSSKTGIYSYGGTDEFNLIKTFAEVDNFKNNEKVNIITENTYFTETINSEEILIKNEKSFCDLIYFNTETVKKHNLNNLNEGDAVVLESVNTDLK